MRAAIVLLLSWTAFGQSAFDVASVKPSQRVVGNDYGNQISIGPTSFSGKNVTLKRLIGEAYGLQLFQVLEPKWLTESEYDVEAKAANAATPQEIRAMLKPVLAAREQEAASL